MYFAYGNKHSKNKDNIHTEKYIRKRKKFDQEGSATVACFLKCHSPVGTLLPSLTLSLHPEGADVRPVPLVIWCGPGQFQQHITRAGRFTELAHRPCAIRIGYLRAQNSNRHKGSMTKKTTTLGINKLLRGVPFRAYFNEISSVNQTSKVLLMVKIHIHSQYFIH